jgi:hypothetical protein
MKEKTIKILLGILYFGIHSVEASVPPDLVRIPEPFQSLKLLPSQVSIPLADIPPELFQSLKQPPNLLLPELLLPDLVPIPPELFQLLELSPQQIHTELERSYNAGVIKGRTLIVWDIDGTLFREGSDQTKRGAIPIYTGFASFIAKTQGAGITNIALTNGGPRYNNKIFENGSIFSLPVSFSVGMDDDSVEMDDERDDKLIPDSLRINLNEWDDISFERIRLYGLHRIGINFNKSCENTPLQQLTTPGTGIVFEEPGRKASERLNPRNTLGTVFINGIPCCAPILIGGVIASNFLSDDLKTQHGHRKGEILELFLNKCQEVNLIFSNIVFVDDYSPCVQDVFSAMKKRNMPCHAFHLIPQ